MLKIDFWISIFCIEYCPIVEERKDVRTVYCAIIIVLCLVAPPASLSLFLGGSVFLTLIPPTHYPSLIFPTSITLKLLNK